MAVWILLSGLDDLFISVVYFLTRRRRFPWPSQAQMDGKAERRIAIFVPLWREHRVIAQMLEHNLAAIRYTNYHVFVGVYPNDELTIRAVTEQARLHPRVHLAMCPNDGPTSKGDCLNAIYARMQDYEQREGGRFRVVVVHDAEDVAHPNSLRLINWFSRRYAMVQVPVLPLSTPLRECTHGLYCDEFAEYQQKDIPVRQYLGGFLPSNGVGTGFERSALERLADTRHGRVFDPACLTEDYENGYQLHTLGYKQIFVPVQMDAAGPVATREYFPRNLRASVAQRSRWVAGIALQSWQQHGWNVPMRQVYWFWRDRKGLVGNLLSPIANLILMYVLVSYLSHLGRPGVWHFGAQIPSWLQMDCKATSLIALIQAGVRTQASARIYGWRFASAVPVRMFWGNLVNFAATAAALSDFGKARWKGRGMAWRKTEHIYPVPQLCLRPASFSGFPMDDVQLRQVVLNHQILSVSSTSAVRESY